MLDRPRITPADARTAYHPRPSAGWLNDPNGVVRHRGRWHVFFQHNPDQARHARIHWGHLSSADLVSWTEHPVAFGPTPGGPDHAGAWSGVAVPGTDPVTMVYTGLTDATTTSTVCLREALDDDLVSWSDPVVVATQPAQAGVLEMRDPYVFEWAGRRFALMGAGLTDGTAALLLYSCDDLRQWRYEGVWLKDTDPVAATLDHAQVWECPQLLQIGGDWVLLLSLVTDNAANGVRYLLGSLTDGPGGAEGADRADGLPRFTARSAGLFDTGRQYYAPQAVPDPAGPLAFGWVMQTAAPEDAPPGAVAGCLTLPRRMGLAAGELVVTVDPALDAALPPGQRAVADLAFGRTALPGHSRVRIRPAGSPSADVVLSCGSTIVPLTVGQRGADIWLDADVAEVYGCGPVPLTVRALDADTWTVGGAALLDIETAAVADPSALTTLAG